jgi:hypothetical protein
MRGFSSSAFTRAFKLGRQPLVVCALPNSEFTAMVLTLEISVLKPKRDAAFNALEGNVMSACAKQKLFFLTSAPRFSNISR